jgi:hypothetical protein
VAAQADGTAKAYGEGLAKVLIDDVPGGPGRQNGFEINAEVFGRETEVDHV